MPRRRIVFQAFFAATIGACSGRKRGFLSSNLMRNPSVCPEESIGLYVGKQWFPREKPMVYSVETAGFSRGVQRSAVGTRQQNGWGWMQNRPKKPHIWLILPRICHSATISVTSQPIVFQSLKPQVTDLQIFKKNFLWYFQTRSFLNLIVSLRKSSYLCTNEICKKSHDRNGIDGVGACHVGLYEIMVFQA